MSFAVRPLVAPLVASLVASLPASLPASLLVAVAVALAACDENPVPPHDPAPLTAAAPSPELPASAAPTASGTAAAADAGGDAGAAALSGVWEGKYDAKKGRVEMPQGVKDGARPADDGKTAAGAGGIEITITPDGEVNGKSLGALGPARVRGVIDGKMLRASFVPNDPLAPHAMTGVLVGIVKGDTIVAELRVAGPDAVMVRQSNVELKRR